MYKLECRLVYCWLIQCTLPEDQKWFLACLQRSTRYSKPVWIGHTTTQSTAARAPTRIQTPIFSTVSVGILLKFLCFFFFISTVWPPPALHIQVVHCFRLLVSQLLQPLHVCSSCRFCWCLLISVIVWTSELNANLLPLYWRSVSHFLLIICAYVTSLSHCVYVFVPCALAGHGAGDASSLYVIPGGSYNWVRGLVVERRSVQLAIYSVRVCFHNKS